MRVGAEEDGIIRRRADVVTKGKHAGLACGEGVVVTHAVRRVGVDDAWITECTGIVAVDLVAYADSDGLVAGDVGSVTDGDGFVAGGVSI